KGAPEHVFDFAFDTFSKEPVAGPKLTAAPAASPAAAPPSSPSPAAPTATRPASGESAPIEVPSGVDPALIPVPIPETVPEILAQLRTRTDQIRGFIDRGSFARVYVPAFQATDLALALDAKQA